MPVKFGDIPKTATEVLNDDYFFGQQLKTKVKTSWDGAIFTSQTDLAEKETKTPTKLTWKFPKPFGISAVSIDKLEMAPSGGLALECASDKPGGVSGLKVVLKSGLADPMATAATVTYTGVKDTQVIVDRTAKGALSVEATRTQGIATCGLMLSLAKPTAPDFGVRVAQGPLFGALLVKSLLDKAPASYQGSCCYKVNDQLKVAVNATVGEKTTYAGGILYDGAMPGLNLRAKIDDKQEVSCCAKYVLSKGFTLTSSAKYSSKGLSKGLSISIE